MITLYIEDVLHSQIAQLSVDYDMAEVQLCLPSSGKSKAEQNKLLLRIPTGEKVAGVNQVDSLSRLLQ